MYDQMSVTLGRLLTMRLTDLKRQEGQGATEYALVIGFVVVTLGIGLATLGGGITAFLGRVKGKLDQIGRAAGRDRGCWSV
jgi:Flp pilus assembly pilin Flp